MVWRRELHWKALLVRSYEEQLICTASQQASTDGRLDQIGFNKPWNRLAVPLIGLSGGDTRTWHKTRFCQLLPMRAAVLPERLVVDFYIYCDRP